MIDSIEFTDKNYGGVGGVPDSYSINLLTPSGFCMYHKV